ncbi:EAL domain-containing protein [Wenzhouxiangella sp. XN201]|uniref:putative bifunctional diguanylate cyclase/phosphodiesterase n=1 Tax=Wenzhouxiangella sp. XN201 TaxID=2710755 RepID=UPI0013C9844E|nr:EAL domain-containing protein [Wenzhouxiangella sp. XN201]NEZ05218.1 EAL domain-containing protein [Wenzhouxiangella sp. XN201]
MKLTGSRAFRVAAIYAAAGVLWIFMSDSAVRQFTSDPGVLTTFQTYKGWLFVLASAVLVFWLSWRALGDQAGLIRELHQSAVVFERSHDGVVLSDHRRRIVSANPAFERMLDRPESRLRGLDLATLHAPGGNGNVFGRIEKALSREGHWRGELWIRGPDNGEYPYQVMVTDIGADRGGRELYAWIFSDIGELKQAQRRLEQLAYYDALTGLPNRLKVQDTLRRVLSEQSEQAERIAVLYIDLDHFRNVNDSFGHPTGDDLLVLVARRLQSVLPAGTGLACLGGDEFLIHASGIDSPAGASELAECTLAAVAEPFMLANSSEVYVTASIGICMYPEDAASATEMLQYANAAMYRAKQRGRNTWQFFSTSMVQSASRRLALDAQLRHALDAEEFVLHYQPVVSAGPQYRVCGVEALVRWRQADGSLLFPTEFIRATEESGLIVPLGQWVLEQACRQAASWENEGFEGLPVAVNLSARQFQTGRMVETVERALKDAKLSPELLNLEITESMLMEQVQAGQDVLRRLRAIGVHVSLDDFGTGYSSLSYVKEFDLDTLKIDRSFIRDLASSDSDRELVAAIIGMARCLRLKVVAEGVETLDQLDILTGMDCDCFQGFFFSQALPAADVPQIARALGQVRPEARSSGP